MSSHHIVREKQEPALLVLGLDNFDDEQLGQLLEWSPTLIATPDIAEKLNAYGIKIDWIITDDAIDNLQSDVKWLPMGKDTVIVAALNYLTNHSYPSVNVVTDEFELDDYRPYVDKINLVVFYDQQKIYAVTPGFSKWKPAGDLIRILSSPANLKITGLAETGDGAYLTLNDGLFTLQFDGPLIFIAEIL
jgi:thiamine pyrophosphokinase